MSGFDRFKRKRRRVDSGIPDFPKDEAEAAMPEIPAPQSEDMPGIPVHETDGIALSKASGQPKLVRQRRRARSSNAGWLKNNPRKARVLVAGMLGLVALGALVPALWLTLNPLPDVAMLKHYTPIEAVRIYDIHDKLAGVVAGDEDRLSVKLGEVSPNMQKAMLAAEDHDFYSHGGMDVTSIGRATLKNLKAGHVVEGASTITQQLVKNVFFPGEARTFDRKIKEALLAMQVDSKYTKDQILEMYLNQIYFGNQSYGIERAAQRYFNKPASKLDFAESAFLAGVVKAPSFLSDPAHRKDAVARQQEVLSKMVEYKMVPAPQIAKAKEETLAFRKYVSPFQKYAFYVAYVMDVLRQKYGEEELARGLKVYTNLDPDAQVAGEKALQKGIDGAPAGVEQGALASVRIDDGAVLALVGGVGQYEKNQWNRAVSPHTMGSSFKPFVYLTGFLQGHEPDDILVDKPVSFPSGGSFWSPPNFEHNFLGPITIKKGLADSRNVIAAKIAYEVGIENVIKTARACGITTKIEPYLPVCIGAAAASPLEMAGAYATFARGGTQMTPQLFRKIEANDGRVIATFHAEPHKVFSSRDTDKLLVCMQEVIKSGTGILAQLPGGRPLAGKTGTSDNARDIWFCGFTADTATACWGGNDQNNPIDNKYVTGGMIMSKIFKDYMTQYYVKHPTPMLSFMHADNKAPRLALNDVPALPDMDRKEAAEKVKRLAEKRKELIKLASKDDGSKTPVAAPQIADKTMTQAAVVDTPEIIPIDGFRPDGADNRTRYTEPPKAPPLAPAIRKTAADAARRAPKSIGDHDE